MLTQSVIRVRLLRNRAFFLSDLILLPLASVIAFVVRFEGWQWPPETAASLVAFLIAALPLKITVLYLFGMYRRLWRYSSMDDLEMTVCAASCCAVISALLGALVLPGFGVIPARIPLSVLLLDACFSAILIATPRMLVRVVARRERRRGVAEPRRALVVGAGVAGGMIVRELVENPHLGLVPVGMLDDDLRKHGLRLHNIPVLGCVDRLPEVAEDCAATDIIVAMPSAPGRILREVVRQASRRGLTTKTVPGLSELLSGRKSVSALRQIEIQDLLRRETIETNLEQVAALVTGRDVLITGAGGSIGSELCRQLAHLRPNRLVVLGRGENSIFELLQEFSRSFPEVRIDPVIADVRDYKRMRRVMTTHRPFSVFHAAAHKHVPLMEANVGEAVLNNVLGTRNVVELASEMEAEHFVLISSDKAVRPTSVMGATKRIAEFLVHEIASRDHSGYVSVRFGNVLGSRGSVVPTFMRQIADGGPVTITHPEMTRYFMTIPEAVQLVLQASALGTEGEVFVLDMGEPVRVLDLASDMIRLCGLEVGIDIDIRFTGMRPGEKLYEELFVGDANARPTAHSKILRAYDSECPRDGVEQIERLIRAAIDTCPPRELRRLIAKLVPEYTGLSDTGEFDVVVPLVPQTIVPTNGSRNGDGAIRRLVPLSVASEIS